jgi:hypothetical protein
MNTLLTKEFLSLNPKVYSIIHQDKNKEGKVIDKKRNPERCIKNCS